MELHGSQTEKNLLKSFAGESQARNRYDFFAKVARKEGYEQIAAIFEETASNEKVHAKKFFRFQRMYLLPITNVILAVNRMMESSRAYVLNSNLTSTPSIVI